jgi:hypothetical protein
LLLRFGLAGEGAFAVLHAHLLQSDDLSLMATGLAISEGCKAFQPDKIKPARGRLYFLFQLLREAG